MENKMSGIVWVITASIVFICIAVVAIFYKLTKLQEETREAYLKFDSYRMEKWNMVKRLAEYVESYHEEEKTFADRLKELRNIRNYTQEELGKITNISVQSIRRYEQGRLNEEPSAYNLLQLAKALDVTPEYLLIGDNNMTSYTEAIKRELKQLNDYGQISEIKETELNSTILSHLEMSNDLVDAVKTDWNAKGIFKRIEKEEDKQIVVDSYCTRPYVQDVILRYCQNRSIFKTKFAIIDGMLLE